MSSTSIQLPLAASIKFYFSISVPEDSEKRILTDTTFMPPAASDDENEDNYDEIFSKAGESFCLSSKQSAQKFKTEFVSFEKNLTIKLIYSDDEESYMDCSKL